MKLANHRVFEGIGALALFSGMLAAVCVAQNGAGTVFHIKAERLQGTLEKLSEFGRNPEGGVRRLGYSDEQLSARKYVVGLMEQAGLTVRVDAAGNLFGRRDGTEKLPVLLFGSHIDSVVKGGNFDGDVGALGAIEVMRALNEAGVKTRHPLEAVVWENEEGNHFGVGTLGSGIAAGLIGPEVLERKDEKGLTLADWAKLAPMGMIFVPSRDGISHSPKEFTSWVDVGNGAEVLYRTVVELDGELNH